MTEEESKQEEATEEDKRQKSMSENLHDETQIKLLNAKLLVMKEEKANDPEYNHAAEVSEKLVGMVGGIADHMMTEITLVKERMRAAFVRAVEEEKGPREALVTEANAAVAGLEELFANITWVSAQTDKFQHVIDEQAPSDGVVKKSVRTVKKLALFPLTAATKGVGWAVDKATFGVVKVGAAKKKVN